MICLWHSKTEAGIRLAQRSKHHGQSWTVNIELKAQSNIFLFRVCLQSDGKCLISQWQQDRQRTWLICHVGSVLFSFWFRQSKSFSESSLCFLFTTSWQKTLPHHSDATGNEDVPKMHVVLDIDGIPTNPQPIGSVRRNTQSIEREALFVSLFWFHLQRKQWRHIVPRRTLKHLWSRLQLRRRDCGPMPVNTSLSPAIRRALDGVQNTVMNEVTRYCRKLWIMKA